MGGEGMRLEVGLRICWKLGDLYKLTEQFFSGN